MYPNSPISDQFVASYADRTPPWGFGDVGYITFKRTYARPIYDETGKLLRTEEWPETVQRVVNGAQAVGAKLTQEEAERLFDYMFNLKGVLSGRMLWQLGTPNNFRLGGDSLVSCWFVDVRTPEDFGWMMERLMLGGGVGFSISHAEDLGMVRQGKVTPVSGPDCGFIVPDNREGWVELLVRTLRAYLGGEQDRKEFTYSTMLIRPYGTPIKTFGGTAAGPVVLHEGIKKITTVLEKAVGRHLTPTEVLDIGNIVGQIVVAGNVRRSAEIALGDYNDEDFLKAKRWDLVDIPAWRAMSNNTVCVGSEDIHLLPDLFWEGYLGNGEPYGMFNLEAAQTYARLGEIRPDNTVSGVNPCGEATLAHRECCNLAEIFLPNVESPYELYDVARLFYKVQKAIAAMPYLDPTSEKIIHENMRLGLAVGGIAQAVDKIPWLNEAYERLYEFDQDWSFMNGWPTSVRLTSVKPSGTVSLLAGVTPGIHPGFSRYFIRRIRMSSNDPLVQYCRDRGYAVEFVKNPDGTPDSLTSVVEFPCELPESTVFAADMTAIELIELQRKIQQVWADNAISISVYYEKDEVPAIREYLKENWPTMKTVSFIMKANDHGFEQAPFEEIDELTYQMIKSQIRTSDLTVPLGESKLIDGDLCATGSCPIR